MVEQVHYVKHRWYREEAEIRQGLHSFRKGGKTSQRGDGMGKSGTAAKQINIGTASEGIAVRDAIQTGLSRKGYWRLSRTLATNSGMTSRWLEEQGLVSIRERWIKIHYPATAR